MRVYKIFTFAVLQNKRLLSRLSFLLVLLMIPVFAFGMKFFFKEESGIYRVTLCSEQSDDATAKLVIERLKNSNTVLFFSECETAKEAEESVKSGKSDAAWIFKSGLEDRIREYCSENGDKKPFIRVLQRDESISANMSREKLFGAVFPEVTYLTFENFLTENLPELQLDKSQIKELYDSSDVNGSLVIFDYLEDGSDSVKTDLLLSPVYGLLAVMTVVCGLTAQMIFLSDKKRGVYDWMNAKKQIFAGIGITFSAVFDGAVAVFLSLLLSNAGGSSALRELISVLCLIAVSTAFCVLTGTVFSSHKILGICIPFITLLLIFVSPIFFSFYQIIRLQRLFPVYYYLNALHSYDYFIYAVVYTAAVFAISFVLDYIKIRIGKAM